MYFFSVVVRMVAVIIYLVHGYLVWVIGCRFGVDFGLCLMGSLSAVTAAYVCVLDPGFLVVFARCSLFLIWVCVVTCDESC